MRVLLHGWRGDVEPMPGLAVQPEAGNVMRLSPVAMTEDAVVIVGEGATGLVLASSWR